MWSSTTPSSPGKYWFKGSFEPIDDVLADLLNVVTIDEEQVIVPGVAGTIPLERFIGEWNGPLQPPYDIAE
ncbi:MAG TPA: hypothetical protein VJQ25_10645 [Nitrospira sp.]|jgi:hypothetical protein|nr:hypothetical protein [Nitrospira sp.]